MAWAFIEWFGLEGTFTGHLNQSPCSEQGHLQLEAQQESFIWLTPKGKNSLPTVVAGIWCYQPHNTVLLSLLYRAVQN